MHIHSAPLTRVLILALFVLGIGVLVPVAASAQDTEVEIMWAVNVPMRDGVELNATVYKPLEMDDPLPVVITMTPYGSDYYHERAWYFAQHGYVFALVDVRGRGNSGGDFDPFAQEAEDGHDAVEWFAEQPWCDGKVAMWGGSYAGYDQWATAKEFPPHLATIVPAAAAFAGVDFPFWKNIPFPYEIQWLTLTSGLSTQWNLFGEIGFWGPVAFRWYKEHRPYTDLPEMAGNVTTKFLEWAEQPQQGPYYDAMNPTDEDFANFSIPILTITGHYDGDQPGAMEFYRRHMRFGSEAGKAGHYLIMGPWDHAGTRTPRAKVGGLTFGDASLLDLNDLHRQWYDWTMKDGDKPEFLKDRIAYFVVGANEWKYADSLEEITAERKKLYLTSAHGRANDVFRSGALTTNAPGGNVKPDSYVYDPLDTRPGELEITPSTAGEYTDQRSALHLFGNGLVYHSEPFEKTTEISGYMKLEAWVAIDVPDTDFQADVYEILPDGSSVRLAQDLMRARFRESLREQKLVTPGEINKYVFDGFYFFSRAIAKGSRLRMVFKSPNTIMFQKNYNSGGVVAHESGADARTATVTLYHDAEHPSFLEIPIVR